MSESLKPTLWRTARALNNADRLNLLRLVDGAKGVRGVVRSGSFVYYGTGSDRSLPVAIGIQKAFRRLFSRPTIPSDWTGRLLPIINAFANPRREEIIRTISQRQPIRYVELHLRVGICESSFLRHLGCRKEDTGACDSFSARGSAAVHDGRISVCSSRKPCDLLSRRSRRGLCRPGSP